MIDMKENIEKENKMEKVLSTMKMVILILEIGWKIYKRDKEKWIIQMVIAMKDNGSIIKKVI